MPTGATCSLEAHRRLRADGLLAADCPNPWDLSEVSDAVFAATGSQAAVVQRLPLTRFRTASANSGHLVAAVLLVEGSLGGVVTLNFDKSMSAALSDIGSGERVAVIGGPDDIANLASVNLVYLHRHAESPPEEWILRSEYLTAVWNDRWEPVIASRILVAPLVVFAGLGSPAATLTETVKRIRQAVPADTVGIYQVDPALFGRLSFTEALEIREDRYLRLGWCKFMDDVGSRVFDEHWHIVWQGCLAVAADNGYPTPNGPALEATCRSLGLVAFGAARARWMMHSARYARIGLTDRRIIAEVMVTADFLATHLGGSMSLREDGAIEIRDGERLLATIGLATGSGIRSLTAAEAALAAYRRYWRWKNTTPTVIVVCGHLPSPAPTTPTSIISDVDENDIVCAARSPPVISVYELRERPDQLADLVA